MKRLLFFVACSFLLFHQSIAQSPTKNARPWQSLSLPEVNAVKMMFASPPTVYSNSVTWGWDGPMSREVIARDLDSLHALGFRVVTIEAGYGMPAEYLSDGWFELVKTAVEEAKKRDMHVWIIDEGKYPSGFAGGKFSRERPDLRMQGLVVYDRINADAGQTISQKIYNPLASAVALNLSDSSSTIIKIKNGALNWKVPAGQWQILLAEPQFKTAVTRAANNPTRGKDSTNALCDYLSPVAVRQFIDFTHEQYKKHIGEEFGKTILGFRGDEPDFAYVPWTPNMLQEFKERKGYDIQPYLASFFLRNLSEEQQRAKADYWDVWSDLFGKNFFQQQADWCAQNNVEYMVHLNHDDAMVGLVRSEGDFFKDFRSVQIPGIDVIWHQVWPGLVADFPKFASSAAHLFGRPRVLSESFAAMRPAPDIEQARWIINQQLVRGVNLFEFMFFPSTSQGKGGARGYMADKGFPALMNYTNRASYLLALGKPTTQIAVYFPTTSLWLGHNESENSTFEIAKQLLGSQHDFDFIDEYALSTFPSKNGAVINKSGQEYRTIIVPSIKVLSKAAYERLRAFARAGGQVIFTGELPTIISEKNFLSAGDAPGFEWASKKTVEASLPLMPTDLQLNHPYPALKYLHRKLQDADLYFLFNESDAPVKRTVSFQIKGNAEEWDAQTGAVKQISATGTSQSQVAVDMQPYESKFIVITH